MCMQSGGNREAARLSGVPIKKVEIIVFTLSGALAAFAGLVLASRMYSGQPSVGSGYEMDAIAAASSAEPLWQADADVSAAQYSVRW